MFNNLIIWAFQQILWPHESSMELFGKSSRVIKRNTSHDIHDSPVYFVRPIHQTFTNILTSSQSVQIFLTTISLIYPHVSCLACSGGSAISQSLMKSVCSKTRLTWQHVDSLLYSYGYKLHEMSS